MCAPPTILADFLELIVSGKNKKTSANAGEKSSRIAASVAADLCAAATCGVWKCASTLSQVSRLAYVCITLQVAHDKGHKFSNNLVKDLCDKMKTSTVMISAYHPLTIGYIFALLLFASSWC